MIRVLTVSALLILTATWGHAQAESDLLRKTSPHSVEITAERFESAVKAKGLKLFPRFDHAAATRQYEHSMPPMVVISFGNPKYGTPLMRQQPSAGIDFPPKALIYEDRKGTVWLAYNSASYLYETIFKRHGLAYEEAEIDLYRTLLEELTDHAVAPGD